MFETHEVSDWRLFINSSLRSLKAVLLQNVNEKTGIPIPHSVHLKETYDIMDVLIDAIQYNTVYIGGIYVEILKLW